MEDFKIVSRRTRTIGRGHNFDVVCLMVAESRLMGEILKKTVSVKEEGLRAALIIIG